VEVSLASLNEEKFLDMVDEEIERFVEESKKSLDLE
jgi:hypothetical protein